MKSESTIEQLNEQQLRNLPVMATCAVVFLLMALGRDLILGDFGWSEPVTLSTFSSLCVIFVLGVVALKTPFSAQLSQAFGCAILLTLALRPLFTMPFREMVFPMVDAMVVFAMGICLLNMRYFLWSLVAFILPWTVIAFTSRPTGQAGGMLGLVLAAALIAWVMLKARIRFHTRLIELQGRVSELESLLPLCAHCKNTRLENGQWIRIEKYLYDTARKRVSHGICTECLQIHYPDLCTPDDLAKASGNP